MKNEIAFRPQTRPGKIIILNIRRLGGIKVIRPSPLIVFSSPSAASQLYAAHHQTSSRKIGIPPTWINNNYAQIGDIISGNSFAPSFMQQEPD